MKTKHLLHELKVSWFLLCTHSYLDLVAKDECNIWKALTRSFWSLQWQSYGLVSLITEGTGKVSVSLAVVEMGKDVATTCSSLSQQSCSLKQFCKHSEKWSFKPRSSKLHMDFCWTTTGRDDKEAYDQRYWKQTDLFAYIKVLLVAGNKI